MKKRSVAVIIFFFAFCSSCFAGGIKGPLFDERIITFGIVTIVVVHILCIFAYLSRTLWLRVLCGVLYLPLLLVPLLLSFFEPGFVILLLAMLAFYIFLILIKRK